MKPIFQKHGYTFVEVMVSMVAGGICVGVMILIIWTGTRGVSRNFSVNYAHMNMALPLQQLVDDVHSAMIAPTLTGTLSLVGSGSVVPNGFGGTYTKSAWSGKLKTPTFASVGTPAGSGTNAAAGIALYLLVSSTYMVQSATTGTYSANVASFPVANGSYDPTSTTINIEVGDSDRTLFLSATNGMHLCIPGSGYTTGTTGTSVLMIDRAINSVTISGSSNAYVASCTLSGSLGAKLTTNGTRGNTYSNVIQAYLAAPVNYFVCGTDLVRLNYDGNWQTIMRNVISADSTAAVATPFRLPYPWSVSPLASGTDGRRAVTVRMAATNPNYSNNINYRGTNSNMLLYDFTVWSRIQLYDELAR